MLVLRCLAVALAPGAVAMRPVYDETAPPMAPLLPHFDAFMQRFGRTYASDSAEYTSRRQHYEERADAAKQQNNLPGRLWTAGVSHLWDWTHEEFSQLHGYKPRRPKSPRAAAFLQVAATGEAVEEHRHKRRVNRTSTKIWDLHALRPLDQGHCGSCWAVTSATVLDAHAEIAGLNRTFSAQHMVNCVPNPHHCGGTGGCDGATVELAYEYLKTVGLATAEAVPYEALDRACEHSKATTAPSYFRYESLPSNKYEPVLLALVNDGPVAVAAASKPWMYYSSGIFDGCPRNTNADHAVTLIGFGMEDSVGYWSIRNSWTEWWGEYGHIRLLRTDDEEEYCGTDNDPKDGLGCDGGPAELRVCGMCGLLLDPVVPHFKPF